MCQSPSYGFMSIHTPKPWNSWPSDVERRLTGTYRVKPEGVMGDSLKVRLPSSFSTVSFYSDRKHDSPLYSEDHPAHCPRSLDRCSVHRLCIRE